MNKASMLLVCGSIAASLAVVGCSNGSRVAKNDSNNNATRVIAGKPAGKAGAVSLYKRLGGETTITTVVNDFVTSAASDPTFVSSARGSSGAWYSNPERTATLKQFFIERFNAASGGPQNFAYNGANKYGFTFSSSEFDAFLGHMVTSLKKFKVADSDSAELVANVYSSRGDFVDQQ